VPVLAQAPDRYLRSPRLRLGTDGAVALHALAWNGRVGEGAREQHLVFAVDPRTAEVVGAPRVVREGRALLGLSQGPEPVVVERPVDEERAVAFETSAQSLAREAAPAVASASVRVERSGGVSTVILCPDASLRPTGAGPDGACDAAEGARAVEAARPAGRAGPVARDAADCVVWRARGTAAAPAVFAASHPEAGPGHWVAFHHDVREDDGTVDLAKWIALRFVGDDGRVWEPASPMVDRDRDREGEEQSFEFPALVRAPAGGLWLFGRGSHAHYRQALGAAGFAPRVALSEGGWGCRGRRVAALALPDGAALLAFRERAGIALARLEAGEVARAAGAPALRPAAIEVRPAPGARSRLAPAPPAVEDAMRPTQVLIEVDTEARRSSARAAPGSPSGPVGPAGESGPPGAFSLASAVNPAGAASRSGPDRAAPPWPRGADGRITLFGDIHQHSAHSDGIGAADEPYLRARHVYGDDFCALTDHESFLGKRIGPGEQAYLEAVAEAHHEPGRFVTLLAYEWTGRAHPGPGHKVVYAPRPGLPVLSRDALPDGASLLAAARVLGAFAVPHHVGWTGADEASHDEALQPVWEICSCHGCYEHFAHALGQRGDLRDQMVDAVLARGARFGFIASSDGHGLLWHHGVARKRDPFRTGLAAVQAEACTREAILAALRERRCYATSGAKILLDVRATATGVGSGQRAAAYRDAPMGSALPAGPARIEVTVAGTAPLARVELVGPGGAVLARVELAGPGGAVVAAAVGIESDSSRAASEVADASPDASAHALPASAARTAGCTATLAATVEAPFVYARVEQRDGERAWSSPHFFGPRTAGA
jgi:hypothetical protein